MSITRSLNNEYYWNGSYCIIAGAHGAACTANYECQVLTRSLTCDITTRTCVCANGLWSAASNTCVPCVTNWYFHDNACYKGVITNRNFEDTTSALINSSCANSFTTNVDLAVRSDFSTSDYSWLSSSICVLSGLGSLNPAVDMYFFGPIQTSNCISYNCDHVVFEAHDCGHGAGHHGMICKYS